MYKAKRKAALAKHLNVPRSAITDTLVDYHYCVAGTYYCIWTDIEAAAKVGNAAQYMPSIDGFRIG